MADLNLKDRQRDTEKERESGGEREIERDRRLVDG